MSEIQRRWTGKTLLHHINELRDIVGKFYDIKVSLSREPLVHDEYVLVEDALEKIRKALSLLERVRILSGKG